MPLTKNAIKQLRLAANDNLAQPEMYDQGEFPNWALQESNNNIYAPCCIAGFLLWNKYKTKEAYIGAVTTKDACDLIKEVADILEVNYHTAHDLIFNFGMDIFANNKGTHYKPGTVNHAKAGVKYINNFIKKYS